MYEDRYGDFHRDPEDGDDVPELVVDEVPGAEEPEEATPVEPVLDEPVGISYTRGPNGRLIQSS